jgi:hypothetical protein
MSEVPVPVTESTAIEFRRKEGTARSFKAIGTLTAGELLKFGASGAVQMVGTETDNGLLLGVALFTATSGNRVTTAKGQMQVRWDGVGTVNAGTTLLVASSTRSGWFTAGTALSGGMSIGLYTPLGGNTTAALAAANSGLLQLVETI